MPDLEHEGEVAEPVQRGVVVELVKVLQEPGPGTVLVGAAVVVMDHLSDHRGLLEVGHWQLRLGFVKMNQRVIPLEHFSSETEQLILSEVVLKYSPTLNTSPSCLQQCVSLKLFTNLAFFLGFSHVKMLQLSSLYDSPI